VCSLQAVGHITEGPNGLALSWEEGDDTVETWGRKVVKFESQLKNWMTLLEGSIASSLTPT
jgi:hypothetical protein